MQAACRHVCFVLVATTAYPASGQAIFSARDFSRGSSRSGTMFGPDRWDPLMALNARGIYVAGAFQISGLEFQASMRRVRSFRERAMDSPGSCRRERLSNRDRGRCHLCLLAGSVGFGNREIFLRKYDEAGGELWSRQIRITAGGYHQVAGVAADASGLYVAAWDGQVGGLVRKYSPAGADLWTCPISVRSLRGVSSDAAGVYIAGTNSTGGFVSKYGAVGDSIWSRQLASSDTERLIPAEVTLDSTGVYVGGTIFRRTGTGDAFVH